MTTNSSADRPLDVVCLCAAWCINCNAYQPVFDALQAQFEGRARFSWIDIEDESVVMGEVEVENFPTLFLVQDSTALFLGPLTPQPGVLTQLVQSALDQRLSPLLEAAAQALAQRVVQHLG